MSNCFGYNTSSSLRPNCIPGSNRWYATALPSRGSRFYGEFQVPPLRSAETLETPQSDRRALVEKPVIYFRDSTLQSKLWQRQFKREFRQVYDSVISVL